MTQRRPTLLIAALCTVSLILGLVVSSAGAIPVVPAATLKPVPEPAARYGHSMTACPTARDIYLFGGVTGAGPSNELWRYDPYAMGAPWQQLSPPAPLPPARFYHGAACVDGKLLIYGGTGAAGVVRSDLWVYNPTTNSWTQQATSGTSPGARYLHSFTAFGGQIYVFGGNTASGLADDHMYIFNPATSTWRRGSAIGTPCAPRYGHTAAPTTDGIVIFGGFQPMSPAYGGWSYNAASDSWQPLVWTGDPYPPFGMAGTTWRDSQIWTFGGEDISSSEVPNVTQITCSSPTSCSSMQLPPLPSGRADTQAVVLNQTGTPYMFVFGGRHGSPPYPISDPLIYDKAGLSTATPTATRTRTVTTTPTRTATSSVSRTATQTQTATRTRTATPPAVGTATPTRTVTATATRTATSPAIGTATPTRTVTATPTRTGTITQTSTPAPTGTTTQTGTPTRTGTVTRTTTATGTPTITPTPQVRLFLPIIVSLHASLEPTAD